MYLWKIMLILNSGKEIHGYYESKHCNSSDTARELIGCSDNVFNAITNKEKTEQILFKVGDVSVLSLSAG